MRHQHPNESSRHSFLSSALSRYALPWLIVAAVALSAACGDDDDDDGSGGSGGAAAAAGTQQTGGSGGSSGGAGSGGTTAGSGGGGTGGGTGGEAGSAGATGGAEVPVTGDRRVPFTPWNDLTFAEFFIEHHQMAIDMAEQVVERGADDAVQALAQQIIDAQTAELEILTTARSELMGMQDAPPPAPADPHADADMTHMMAMSGAELDRMFLLDMIQHHASGLPPAHRALPELQRTDLRELATQIWDAQAQEIGEMRALLTTLGVEEAGEDMAPAAAARPDFGLTGDRRVPLTPADDVQFVDFFISHHEMAIMMAEHVIENGSSPEVIQMAQTMRDAQAAELETMRAARMAVAGSAEPPEMPADPHADPEMQEMMMMTGEALDRMFLEEMITHHAAGLPTAHRAQPHVMRPELLQLADDMFLTQAEEIGEMKELLEAP